MEETQPPRQTGVPCGHDDDCVTLLASGLAMAYCSRCERGFELGPVAPVLSVRDTLPLLASP